MKAARLLRPEEVKAPKGYVKYRIVCPDGPLRLMEWTSSRSGWKDCAGTLMC